MTWVATGLAALKRIVLLEERITNLSTESKALMESCKDLDRRLLRIEAKFELIERLASTPRPRSLARKRRLPPTTKSKE